MKLVSRSLIWKTSIVVSSIVLTLSFQNCSDSAFSFEDLNSVKFSEVEDREMTFDGTVDDDSGERVAELDMEELDQMPVVEVTPRAPEHQHQFEADHDEKDCQDKEGHKRDDHSRKHRHLGDDEAAEDDDRALYACLLEGSGRSKKLGLVAKDDKLVAQTSVSESVCMSQYACENIVSQKFAVLMANKREYCRGNKNVVRLSDMQVQVLIDRAQ